MSLRVEHQNSYNQDDQKKVDSKKAPLESSSLEFEAQMKSGDTQKDWKGWEGYKPEYDQFEDKVKIEETDDTIKAEVDDASVPPEKKGILDEFVSWFKAGMEKLAKDIGKMLEFVQASMAAMSVEQALSQVFQSLKLDSSRGSRQSQLPPESQKALADASAKGPENLAKVVNAIVAQNPSAASAISAAAMKELAQANPATTTDAAAQIVQAAVQANPEAAAQITGAAAQSVIDSLPPESAADVLAAITKSGVSVNPKAAPQFAGEMTKAAVSANPEAAPQIAGEVAQAAIQAAPATAPQIAGEVTKSAVSANPEAAPQIAGEVVQAAGESVPDAKTEIAGQVAKVVGDLNPQAAGQIAREVAKATAQTSAFNESSEQNTPQAGPLKNEVPSGEGEPTGVLKSKSLSASEAAAAASATAPASIPAGTVSMEAAPAPAASSALDKRMSNLLADIVKTVKEMSIGETSTTISFNDATLRDVTVEISLNNGRLEVAFTTSDPDSQALLQNNMAALQGALQAASGSSSVSINVTGGLEFEASSESTDGIGAEQESKTEKFGSDSNKKVSGHGGASAS